jgi:hypothetical protein
LEHFSRNFRWYAVHDHSSARVDRLARVNEAATPRRILLRSGTEQRGAAIFMISKLRLQIARPA